MMRNIKYDSSVMLFESWEMRMFDELSSNPIEISDELLSKSTKDLIQANQIVNFEENIRILMENCMLQFKYEQNMFVNNENLNDYISNIIELVSNDQEFVEILKEKTFDLVEKSKRPKDWKKEIFHNGELIADSSRLSTAITACISREIENSLTLIIYILEEKSAFLSYFSSADTEFAEIIKDIWKYKFNRLHPGEITLQNVRQGNLLKLEYKLDFPFAKDDYKIISDLYRKYKITKANEDNIDDPIIIFKNLYSEKSTYVEKLILLQENLDLQSIYFRDMIKIILTDHLLNLRYLNAILEIWLIFQKDIESFEEKLVKFFEFESLALCLNQIFQLLDLQEERVQNFIQKNFAIDPEHWSYVVCRLLKSFIKESYPSVEYVLNDSNQIPYSDRIEKLYNLLIETEIACEITIENLDILEFWTILAHFISRNKLDMSIAIHLYENRIEYGEDEKTFIYNPKFVEHVFEVIKREIVKDPNLENQSLSFKSSYLKLLINKRPKYIEKIAEEIENSEMWKYSTKLISFILRKSKIMKSINMIDQEIQNGNDVENFLKDFDYNDSLENSLKKYGLESKFGVLLSDVIYKFCLDEDEELEEIDMHKNILEEKFETFKYYFDCFNEDSVKYPHLKKLISSVQVRIYLESYSNIIKLDLEDLDENLQEIMRAVDDCICGSKSTETLKLFCLKIIYYTDRKSFKDFSDFLQNKQEVNWIKEIEQLQANNRLDIFPYFPKLKDPYLKISGLLNAIVSGRDKKSVLDDNLMTLTTPELKIAFGLSVLNQVSRSYMISNAMDPNILDWFTASRLLMIRTLGNEFFKFLDSLVHNFRLNEFLSLNPLKNDEEINTILVICTIIIVILAHSNYANPISSIFFNNTGIENNFENRFKDLFIISSEPDAFLQYSKNTLENFDNKISTTFNTSYSKGSTYKCSCNFIYFIDRCGGPMELGTCMFCLQTIGGLDHKIYARPGHENLTHEDAREFLKNLVQTLENQTSRGCKNFNTSGNIMHIRGLKPVTANVLHLILGSSFYFMLILDIVSLDSLQNALDNRVIQDPDALAKGIKNDLLKLQGLIRSNESHIWIYKILSELPELMLQFNAEPTTQKIRDDFEAAFEAQIINAHLNVTEVILHYKYVIKSDLEFEASFKDYIEELKGHDEPKYPLVKLFRIRENPNFESLKNAFLFQNMTEEYELLKIFINNSDDIKKVETLCPIIEFTNALLKIYNHKIPRQRALKYSIKEAIEKNKSKKLRELFDDFVVAWNNKGLDEMSYNCKNLKNIEFDEDTCLAYFLVDVKEHGGGMYMAACLFELAEIQNKQLIHINNIISSEKHLGKSSIIDPIYYPIQKVQKDNLLNLLIDDPYTISLCSFNNPEYGKGRDISYDFARLQINLVKNVINKKFLEKEQLDMIQYQFELLNIRDESSGLIVDIRNQTKQEPFEENSQKTINYFFKNLKEKEKNGFSIKLKEIYSSLNYILCYLKNSRQISDISIFEFCKKLNTAKLSDYFKTKTQLSEIKIKCILALYEKVELEYFPDMIKYIRSEYKSDENAQEIELKIQKIIELSEKDKDMPSRIEIQNAITRFIMRSLTGDLDVDLKLSMYVLKPDFWEISVSYEKVEKFSTLIPVDIKLKHSVMIQRLISEINNKIDHPREDIKMKTAVRKSRKNTSKVDKFLR